MRYLTVGVQPTVQILDVVADRPANLDVRRAFPFVPPATESRLRHSEPDAQLVRRQEPVAGSQEATADPSSMTIALKSKTK